MSKPCLPLLLLLAALAVPVLAALPPQSREELRQGSDAIVVGEVWGVYTRTVPTKVGTDLQYLAQVKVARVEKGEGLGPKAPLYVHFWQPESRPQGWAGPQGQNDVPPNGEPVRMYLKRGQDGSWSLLNPNGWEAAGK